MTPENTMLFDLWPRSSGRQTVRLEDFRSLLHIAELPTEPKPSRPCHVGHVPLPGGHFTQLAIAERHQERRCEHPVSHSRHLLLKPDHLRDPITPERSWRETLASSPAKPAIGGHLRFPRIRVGCRLDSVGH